ncbi:MAG: hypothetical protein WA777_15925 [Rhodanobacter sp.]
MAKKFHLPLLIVACLFAVAMPALAQQSDTPTMTLDQAVLQVQRQTGGKVLSAEPRKVSRHVEYRVKVLTPEGHVRVIAVPSDAVKSPDTAPSTKKPAGNGTGYKEKH